MYTATCRLVGRILRNALYVRNGGLPESWDVSGTRRCKTSFRSVALDRQFHWSGPYSWPYRPACAVKGNWKRAWPPSTAGLCGDKIFYKICSLFSIPYRPISPAAPSPPVTLAVGRFMPSSHSSRLASFRIRARSQYPVHLLTRIGFLPLPWRMSNPNRTRDAPLLSIGFVSSTAPVRLSGFALRPQAKHSTCLTPKLASFHHMPRAFKLGSFGKKPGFV